MRTHAWLVSLAIGAATAAVGASATAASNDLVRDGSFEEHGPLAAWLSLRAGSSAVPGWRITSGNVALVGRYFHASHGANSLEVGSPGPGVIEQTIATTPGRRYRLSFALAGNPDGAPRVKRVTASAGTTSRTFAFDVTGRTRDALGWVIESFDFDATSSATTIRFARYDGGASAWWGPLIDDVSVRAADAAVVDTPAPPVTPAPLRTVQPAPTATVPSHRPTVSPRVVAAAPADPFGGLWQAAYPQQPVRLFLERHGNQVIAHAIDGNGAIAAGHIAWEGPVDRSPPVVLATCVDPDAKGWHGAVIEWIGHDAFVLRVADCRAGSVLYTRTP